MIEIDHEVVALIAEWAQQMEKRVMRVAHSNMTLTTPQ